MNTSKHWLGALATSAGLLSSQLAFAQCPPPEALKADGDTKVLRMSGKKPGGPQKILVIPVVDSTYPYDPAARKFVGSVFEAQLATIQNEYQTVAQYWEEASYGNVKL